MYQGLTDIFLKALCLYVFQCQAQQWKQTGLNMEKAVRSVGLDLDGSRSVFRAHK